MRYKIALMLSLCMIAALILAGNIYSPKAQQPKPALAKLKPSKLTSHVVLISISGLRADDANNANTLRLKIPTVQALRAKGSYAVGVESVYPSQTLPAHTTIVTGLLPADHGITSDFPFDEQTGLQSITPHSSAKQIKADTLWEAAKRDGLITAAIGYPLTVDAAINFNLPEIKDGREAYSIPHELMNEMLAALKMESEAVSLGSKSTNLIRQTQDNFKAEAAAYIIEKHRPNLLLLNFTSLELAQRRFGLRSAETQNALELIDGLVQKIISATERAKLADSTTFLITSDHGASQVEREFRPNVVFAKKGFLTTTNQGNVKSWRAIVQSFGGSAAVFLKNPRDEATISEVEKLFNELGKDSDNPIWRITTRREAAKLGGDPRIALYLDAAPRHKFSSRTDGSAITKTEERAAHGYLPSRADMRATLMIAGKGIKANQRIEYARLIDIAPTIARLLGLEMKSARGRVLTEVITQ